jgi:hypothetical protein
MDWSPFLEPGEVVEWEGRPAPRCFTFRHWKQAAFGLFFLVVCLIWLLVGARVAQEYQKIWLSLLPVPFVAIGCYLAFGPLLLARLEWENVYYALTDRRLITLRGVRRQQLVAVGRDQLTYFLLKKQGEQLATLQVHARPEDPVLFLHCVEHPFQLADRLEKNIERNLATADKERGSAGAALKKGRAENKI